MNNILKFKEELDTLLSRYPWYISTSIVNNKLEVNISHLAKDAECVVPRTFCGLNVKIIVNNPIKLELL